MTDTLTVTTVINEVTASTGATSLATLSDVTLTSVINGQAIIYNSTTGKWENQNLAGGGDLLSANNLSDVASAATSRTNLGLAIGTNVQAWDAQLDDISALSVTDGNIIVGNGTNWIAESGATARASLGLAIGTDVQAYLASIIDGQLSIEIDGQGSVITTGTYGYWRVPYNCTITTAEVVADQSGSIVIDVWKDTYANYPPTVADTITAAAKPTLSVAIKSQDATLTGWTTTCTKGDYIAVNVDSVTTCTKVTLTLWVTKT